jgi:predicted metal-dependent HD superfamily phosphohydrolase
MRRTGLSDYSLRIEVRSGRMKVIRTGLTKKRLLFTEPIIQMWLETAPTTWQSSEAK